MDSILFTTDNNEYIIELSKEKRYFNYNKYSQYCCKIIFYNFLRNPVLVLETNELNLIKLASILFDDAYLFSQIFQINFDNNISLMISSSEVSLYPSEEDPILYFQFIESHPLYGNITRLFLQSKLNFKDDLVYNIYQLLSDIPNLNELQMYDMQNYMEGEY